MNFFAISFVIWRRLFFSTRIISVMILSTCDVNCILFTAWKVSKNSVFRHFSRSIAVYRVITMRFISTGSHKNMPETSYTDHFTTLRSKGLTSNYWKDKHFGSQHILILKLFHEFYWFWFPCFCYETFISVGSKKTEML